MDRLVDYLVGDGPNNRYALICKQCQTHNGMALKEEFEFVGKAQSNREGNQNIKISIYKTMLKLF
jgi:hypothetical protein